MIEVGNLLPDNFLKEVKSILYGDKFPWFYYESVGSNDDEENIPKHPQSRRVPGFVHILVYTEDKGVVVNSECWEIIKPISYFIADKCNIDFKDIIRCKVNMTTPLPDKDFNKDNFSIPHVDHREINNKTAIFYVDDSDGDTVIFNEIYNGSIPESVTIKEKIVPKSNKVIVFDGNVYHAGSLPLNNKSRMTINFNLEI